MSQRIMVKVCGITEERDAHESIHLGADALGFDFRAGSPRAIDPALARSIVERLPAFVATVGVFADDPLIQVMETARRAGVGLLQFHGNEMPALCAGSAPYRWIKAFRVGDGFDPDDLGYYPTTTYLIDARGHGADDPAAPFEWRRVRGWSTYGRIVIAGSFSPAQIGMAIEDARPYGVDVLDEVEIAPGKKDLDRLELLLAAVRRAERRIAGEAV
jgi:phosphoribosylanthranilate isomerase